MNTKIPKYSIPIEAAHAARQAAISAMHSSMAMGQIGYSVNSNSMMGMLTDLVARAVEAGVQAGMNELVNNLYTDDDFNKDIGLNS